MASRSFWSVTNQLVKKCSPSVHGRLKRAVQGRQWPMPKLLMGHVVWAHPRVATQRVTEKHVLRWISERLQPGGVFVDVGAHCGWMSLEAARVVGPGGTVVAFEPAPPLIEILDYHKRVNDVRQVRIVGKAVAERDAASITLSMEGDGLGTGHSLTRGAADARFARRTTSVQVESARLDTYCETSGLHPTVVKIDVEGAERMVLEGSQQMLKRCHPRLILAVHPPWLARGQSAPELFALLKNLEYRLEDSRVTPFEGHEFGDYLFA